MGRLPDTFANKKIWYRQPYTMPGAVTGTTGQLNKAFPDATFQNSTDKPYEIHRLIPRIIPLSAANAMVVGQDQLDLLSLVLLNITDLSKNSPFTKAPARASALVKGSSELTWEFAEPYYLEKSEQIVITANFDAFPAAWASLSPTPITQLKVEVDLGGFFVVITPPSNTR